MIKYDLINNKFGKLTVIKNVQSKKQNRMWLCKCDCGLCKITSTKMLLSGQCVTCGCSKYTRALKHGMAGSKPYHVWFQMKKRILNSASKDYNLYGGRGLTIEEGWKIFQNFWNDMKDSYKEGLYLDRIDNNKGYHKENCRWTNSITQANNTRKNIFLSFSGEKKTISQWSRELGFGKDIIWKRIRQRGWSVEKALTTPVKK